MKNPFLVGFALFCMLVLGTSCVITVLDFPQQGQSSPRIEFQRSLSFLPEGTLSLSNFDGNIEIIGWEEQEVEVYAEKSLYDWDRPKVMMWKWKDPLPQIDIDQLEEFIRIKTRSPDRGGEDFAVDYALRVPNSINLKDILARDGHISISDIYGEVAVELRVGDIVVENFSGTLKATVMEGSIEAGLYDLRREDTIRLKSHSGDITVYLLPDVQARIEVFAPNGSFESEFQEIQAGEDGRFQGEIGSGGTDISLTAMEGNIRVLKIIPSGVLTEKPEIP